MHSTSQMTTLAVTSVSSLRCHISHLFSHGLEVTLHSVDGNRDAVDEGERLRVFCQYRREYT